MGLSIEVGWVLLLVLAVGLVAITVALVLYWRKRKGLLDSVVERESLGSTGLPNGLAIPHPRQPLPYATAEPLICLGRVQAGIFFEARDGVMSDLFVLICSHEDRQHLQVLARLMRMFDEKLLADLRSTDDAETALEMVLAKEEQVIAGLTKNR